MSKQIIKTWFIPSEEDMSLHKEIKTIYLDDDESGYLLASYSKLEQHADLFDKYPAYGLVRSNEKTWKRLYDKGLLIYGAVPLYEWDSENGKWKENKKLRKYCSLYSIK